MVQKVKNLRSIKIRNKKKIGSYMSCILRSSGNEQIPIFESFTLVRLNRVLLYFYG